jgi:hypothetical protein
MSFAEKVQKTVETWHASSLAAYLRCGEAYRRKYVEHDHTPATTPQIRGGAVHRAIGTGLIEQQRAQAPAPLELYEDVAASQVDLARRAGATLTKEELSIGVAKVFGVLKDHAVAYAGGYATGIAAQITPLAVERTVTITGIIPDVHLKGTIDLVDATPGESVGETIRDVKTSERTPPDHVADTSDQLTMYSLFRQAEKPHRDPRPVSLDYLIRRKNGEIEAKRLNSVRGPADYAVLTRRIQAASRGLRAGTFLPSNPATDWWCSEKFCPYWSTCLYVNPRA